MPSKNQSPVNVVHRGKAELTASRGVLSNTLYLTLNAPQVDDYHRALFITSPVISKSGPPTPPVGGTLFHAAYVDSVWSLEKRHVTDFTASTSLVLLWRIATFEGDVDDCVKRVDEVLTSLPLGKQANGGHREGNPELGGYDCVIWTEEALKRLVADGLIDVGEKGIDQIMAEARAFAGPEDARTMVGKDFGGLRIVNNTL